MRERLEGGILGLLIGDALGVPYEFKSQLELPPFEQLEMTPPAGYPRTYPSVPAGTWSDDGAQALALLSSLLDRGYLDLDDVARRLVDWHEHGAYTPDGIVFDVGNQTRVALRALRSGARPETAGPADERSNGNGSLMRVLPLALWHRGPDEDLARDAMRQSSVTHGHLRSQVACALYCIWARRTMHRDDDPWDSAVHAVRGMFTEGSAARAELDGQILNTRGRPAESVGYVVDALHAARWAVGLGGYEDVVKGAISLGGDTDTNACIAGGIAGLRDGVSALPARWRDGLRGMEIVRPLLDQLVRVTNDECRMTSLEPPAHCDRQLRAPSTACSEASKVHVEHDASRESHVHQPLTSNF